MYYIKEVGWHIYASVNQAIIGSDNGSVPSHYLKEYSGIVNQAHGSKLKWNCYRSTASFSEALQWRHNEPAGVSNHQPHDCLLNRHSGADRRKDQSSASLAFVRGIHRWPVNSPHKGPITRKKLPFDDVIMGVAFKMLHTWKWFGYLHT